MLGKVLGKENFFFVFVFPERVAIVNAPVLKLDIRANIKELRKANKTEHSC